MKMDGFNGRPVAVDAPKRCIINLSLPAQGAAVVRSIDLYAQDGCNRTSFSGAHPLEEVFEAGIAMRLRDTLQGLSQAVDVVALPDQVIEAKGLILSGMHLMCSYAEDGSASVMIRFKKMVGDWRYALIGAVGLGVPMIETRDMIAMRMLTEISMPLLDICNCADADALSGRTQGDPYFRHIAEHANEIRFQVELIKRYIAAVDRMDLPDVLPDAMMLPVAMPRSAFG